MRYLPLSEDDRRHMLAEIGADGIDALFKDVPASALAAGQFDLPDHAGEMQVETAIEALAAKNTGAASAPFISAPAPITIISPPPSIIWCSARSF